MPDPGERHRGYLVLADISGYTSFLTNTELEHAQSIVAELMALIHDRLVPPLHFVELEGDAIFCFADSFTFDDAERLLELIEVCYCDFSDRLFDMARATTCGCAACACIDRLDLKFVAHYGSYVVHQFAGRQKLAGPDVILAHRLLKNDIAEQTGAHAYAFFTDPCLERLPSSIKLPKHTETCESLGQTAGGVHDLRPVLEVMREERRDFVSAADADFAIAGETPVPPAVLWQYWVDADKRLRWDTTQNAVQTRPNEGGRLGLGATTHCAHGRYDLVRHYVDWRPFQHFTWQTEPVHRSLFAPPPGTHTIELEPRDDGGTVVYFRFRLRNRGRLSGLLIRLVAPLLRRQFQDFWANLRTLGEEDELLAQYFAAREGGDDGPD